MSHVSGQNWAGVSLIWLALFGFVFSPFCTFVYLPAYEVVHVLQVNTCTYTNVSSLNIYKALGQSFFVQACSFFLVLGQLLSHWQCWGLPEELLHRFLL